MDAAEERHRLEGFPTIEIDPEHAPGGLLLSDEIAALCGDSTKMIDPFDPAMLRAASYRLRVGDQFRKGSTIGNLQDTDGKREIRIEPGEMVVIQTFETINLPRFIIARWNMKVDLVYKGLLWVGGPQVDPGWLGHLQCPIYNLSNETVVLSFKDSFAIMDFERTTGYDPKKCYPYKRPPQRVTMDEYLYGALGSSPTAGAVSGVKQQLDDVVAREVKFEKSVEDRIEKLTQSVGEARRDQVRERDELRATGASAEEEVAQLRQSVFTVMTVFVAAVGALATAVAVFVAKGGAYVQPEWFDFIATGLLFASVVGAAYAAAKASRVATRVELLWAKVTHGEAGSS
jgi:deoxycytidine triphosphate deaminase